MKKYIVLEMFADKDNIRKHYEPGEELPGTFSEGRLENIVKLGLAKEVDTEAGSGNDDGNGNNTGTGDTATDIDLTGKASDIIAQVKGFADVERLKQYLETEKSAEKPRQTVMKAIEDRLANIVT
jgi:hypothetical protein